MSSSDTRLRPETVPAEIERQEQQWWETFAELENRFAWVQTPQMQDILRGHYLRGIIGLIPRTGRVLELGCGTGWLCFALARFGARDVWGIDFSAAQIAIARAKASELGIGEHVHFICADGTQVSSELGQFDCVVVHAFLHHLTSVEIKRTLSEIPKLLKPGGVLIAFEPVYHAPRGDGLVSIWQRWLGQLAGWAVRGRRWKLRVESAEETYWRAMFAKRHVGITPHGPSPKEMPFAPEELDEYFIRDFFVQSKVACMSLSHFVVQEWLLRELSHPISTRALLPWIARVAAWLDRRLVSQPMRATGWVFMVYALRPINKPGS